LLTKIWDKLTVRSTDSRKQHPRHVILSSNRAINRQFLNYLYALSKVSLTKAGAVGYAGEGSLDRLQKNNLTEAVKLTTSPSIDRRDLVRLPELALASLCFNVG
jgi:hypothetical protein